MKTLLHTLLFTFCFSKQVKLLIEVSRHGARNPSHIYPYTADPAANFVYPYNLTQKGANQHYSMGGFIRDRYVNEYGFLSENYTDMEFYV